MKRLIMILTLVFVFFQEYNIVSAEGKSEINIISEAAVLIDTRSGAILFSKNENKKMYPASLTKIATAIYALEKGDLEDTVTISGNAANVDGTRVYLNEGEKVSLRKLIQGLIINSGNDAAVAIAEHVDGSLGQFSENLNLYIKDLGALNTNFTNPHGLFDENHYTTANDLALILKYAMLNKDFKEIFSTKELAWRGDSWETTIFSHHRMLKGEIPYEWVTGGKTGFVNEAKQTLATTASNDQIQLASIVLKSDFKRDIYQDTIKIFDYGFTHFKTVPITQEERFYSGENVFKPNGDSYVTEPLENAQVSVSHSGLLAIQNESGTTIQQLQLGEVAVDKKEVISENDSETTYENSFLHVNSFVAFGLAIITIVVWLLNRKLVRSRQRKIERRQPR